MKISILMVILFFTGIGMHLLSPKNKLDVRLYYSVSEAEEFFSQLGPTESHNYRVGEILDLFFILNYSLICFLAFDSFFPGKWRYVLFLPGLMDLVETISILLKLKGHQISLSLLSYSTTGKWAAGVALLFVLIYQIFRRPRIDA
jgi:hypothetical protein